MDDDGQIENVISDGSSKRGRWNKAFAWPYEIVFCEKIKRYPLLHDKVEYYQGW